ncbi:hypothetical protein [Sinosporangium siamense]|uniref:SCP2 domain-containing protein n=1 Tax=Sinosporangium siamense TaxID=1367973 RepID=A0A919RRD6_9ACTN|nr:hypothetical protein [Sinosporangium siamense]GII96849.1 hypothetical protein Ssi02_70800 [Sinosporangium siamense]
MRFDNPGFVEALTKQLGANARFERETRWFDGSILLESGSSRLWLKVYRGKVIDHLPFQPPIGFTFKLGGPAAAWNKLLTGERRYADLVTPGVRHFDDDPALTRLGQMTSELGIEGNLMEASRLTEAVHTLVEIIIEVGQEAGA